MVVVPALDLYDGRVVRMVRGDERRMIRYAFDPIVKLREFIELGFNLIHVVDLSQAIDGTEENLSLLKRISGSGLSEFVQIGGGIRNVEYSQLLLEMGFRRQVLSSLVIENGAAVPKLVEMGAVVVFSLDTDSIGNIKIRGWKETVQPADLGALGEKLRRLGITELIHTDTSADGTLAGRNLELTERIARLTGLNVIVAGGIRDRRDLENVERLNRELRNVKGVIVGRALYEGLITLEEMVEYAR